MLDKYFIVTVDSSKKITSVGLNMFPDKEVAAQSARGIKQAHFLHHNEQLIVGVIKGEELIRNGIVEV